MGCLKLTYDYQEQGEKNDSLKWSVWVNPESDFLGVVDHQTQRESLLVLQAGLGEDSYDFLKFGAGFGGVIQAGSETFNALWDGRKAIASKGLVALGRFTGVLGAIDHSENLVKQFKNGGLSNPKTYYYAGALAVDVVFTFGKVSNPIYLGANALYSLVDMGLGVYWEQKEQQSKLGPK
jgi:hypothetical protein